MGGARSGLLLPLAVALSVALAPAVHRAAPVVPDWALTDLCGETEPGGALPVPCVFCLLMAAFVLAAVPAVTWRVPVLRVIARCPTDPGLCPTRMRAFARPPSRGPPRGL